MHRYKDFFCEQKGLSFSIPVWRSRALLYFPPLFFFLKANKNMLNIGCDTLWEVIHFDETDLKYWRALTTFAEVFCSSRSSGELQHLAYAGIFFSFLFWQSCVYRSFRKCFEQLHMKLFNLSPERKDSRSSAQIRRLSMRAFAVNFCFCINKF